MFHKLDMSTKILTVGCFFLNDFSKIAHKNLTVSVCAGTVFPCRPTDATRANPLIFRSRQFTAV